MILTRRGFLKTCLALAAAPAIVRADSLMKLWVPPQGFYLVEAARTNTFLNSQDFSRATWATWTDTRGLIVWNRALTNEELMRICE